MIYLDYNATAPLHTDVKKAMDEVAGLPLNPSSIHAAGREARRFKEDARRKILDFVSAEALVFCGSGTEANNLALSQVGRMENGESRIIISAVEHDSIYKAAENPIIIPVDESGLLDLEELTKQFSILNSQFSILVSIIMANNETGVVQDIPAIAEIVHEHDALLHIDAVQAFGKIDLDFAKLGADMMTISCHKIGGPVGVAALCHRPNLELKPILKGGGQEMGKRSGTEDVKGIVGFAATTKIGVQSESGDEPALSNAPAERQQTRRGAIKKLRDYLEEEISKLAPDAIIHGQDAPRIPNTSNISMPNMEAATQLIHFDSKGICVSSGSACSSGKVETSRVLEAMNAPLSKNAIRISLGWGTTKEEVDKFIAEWSELYKRASS